MCVVVGGVVGGVLASRDGGGDRLERSELVQTAAASKYGVNVDDVVCGDVGGWRASRGSVWECFVSGVSPGKCFEYSSSWSRRLVETVRFIGDAEWDSTPDVWSIGATSLHFGGL